MANVTDPLVRSVQGSDPQNLMEYITRQKIYESRFWKEECFGLTAADVIEKAATSLSCVGGTFGGAGRPTKFLILTLKLLQLQPSVDIIQTFLEQNEFKYLKALGCFYLRLTGRPQEIYEYLEPFYADYSKLRYRGVNEWKLIHVDEFIDELLKGDSCCGIAMPRLPLRSTLFGGGYLEEEERSTSLQDLITESGGIKQYLKIKVDRELEKEKNPIIIPTDTSSVVKSSNNNAVAMWEKYYGKEPNDRKRRFDSETSSDTNFSPDVIYKNDDKMRDEIQTETLDSSKKQKGGDEANNTSGTKRKKEKKNEKRYGSLFK